MSNYAKLWLGYKSKKENKDCKCLKQIRINGADEADVITKNAVKELKEGLKAMVDIEPEVSFGTAVAPVAVSCGKDIQDNEEYKISGTYS